MPENTQLMANAFIKSIGNYLAFDWPSGGLQCTVVVIFAAAALRQGKQFARLLQPRNGPKRCGCGGRRGGCRLRCAAERLQLIGFDRLVQIVVQESGCTSRNESITDKVEL